MKRIIFFILCSVFSLVLDYDLQAQNLIPNPGFEEASRIPKTRPGEANGYRPADWGWPTRARPDFYFRGEKGRFSTDRKGYNHNDEYYQGHAMAGIMGNSLPDSNQYLQVKLKKKLIKNQVYCLSINTRPPASCTYSPNEIDYCFSSYRIDQRAAVSGRLMVSNYKKINGFFPRSSWSTHYCSYTAIGDEEYLIIGFINPDYKLIPFSNARPAINKEVYLFIDELSLLPMNEQKFYSTIQKCECLEAKGIQTKTNDFGFAINIPLVLKNINFESGSAKLHPASNEELNKLVLFLKTDSLYKIEISGYTDNTGNEDNNKILSLERAKAIAIYLVAAGIDLKRITYKGFGSQNSLKPNNSEENKALNRRVEIKLIK